MYPFPFLSNLGSFERSRKLCQIETSRRVIALMALAAAAFKKLDQCWGKLQWTRGSWVLSRRLARAGVETHKYEVEEENNPAEPAGGVALWRERSQRLPAVQR